MRKPLFVAGLALLVSCNRTPPAPPSAKASVAAATPAPPAPPITGLPATFTLKQRSQSALPGAPDSLKVSIDDITRGKIQTSIRSDQQVLLQPTYLAQGNRQTFEYQQRKYELTLVELNNSLVGEDFATFKLTEAAALNAPATKAALTESQKIDRLIARVESLEQATFIRNETEHTPKEAAKHLRDKREYAGEQLKTATQFIDEIGSRSSLSGDEYQIRFKDGRVVKAGDFLREELKALASDTAAPAAAKPQ